MKKKLLKKSRIRSIKKKVKEIGINIFEKIKKECTKREETIICLGLLAVGGVFVYCWFKGKGCKEICLSLGTGIITSSIVSFIINLGNDCREKRRIKEDKDIIFRELVNNCIFVYLRKIKEINTVAAFSFPCMKFVGNLFDDFSIYEEFEKNLQSLSYDKETEESKQRLNQLFDFQDFEIKALAINFRALTAENYLAMNLLEEEEFEKIGLREEREVYFDEIAHATDFYNHKVIDYGKCIEVLNYTMRICSNIISLFDGAIKDIKENEFYLEQYINTLDTRSEKEIEEDALRKAEEQEEFFDKHPDIREKYEKEMNEVDNRSEEDIVLDNLEHYLLVSAIGRASKLRLNALDLESEKVKKFFSRQEIREVLKKDENKKEAMKKYLDKNYLKKVLEGKIL